MNAFHLLQLQNVPIFQQLQIEEALLRADDRNWCIINDGSEAAIVMGISGKTSLLVDKQAWQKNPLPIIRRFSGGGTVVVDTNTLFMTWIANTRDIKVPCCPQKIFRWSETLYQSLMAPFPFQLIENDYVINQRKCGGNAQYLCKDRWLHHTSFLWDYDPANMRLLKMPPKTPVYRLNRPHEEFICRLKDFFYCKETFYNSLIARLSQKINFNYTDKSIIPALLEKEHRKTTVKVEMDF